MSARRVHFGMCSPLHLFYLEDLILFACANSAPCLLCLPRSQLLCAHHCTLSFCVCLDWPKLCTCAHQCTTSASVCLEGPIWYVLTNAPLLFGGAQFCFPVLTNAPCLLCLPKGPNSYVLSIAPCLCVCLDWPKVCSVLTNAPRL